MRNNILEPITIVIKVIIRMTKRENWNYNTFSLYSIDYIVMLPQDKLI
jgi:hypothetical protein